MDLAQTVRALLRADYDVSVSGFQGVLGVITVDNLVLVGPGSLKEVELTKASGARRVIVFEPRRDESPQIENQLREAGADVVIFAPRGITEAVARIADEIRKPLG